LNVFSMHQRQRNVCASRAALLVQSLVRICNTTRSCS
jgi:hypothetical protein